MSMNPLYDRKIYIQGNPNPYIIPGEVAGERSVNELLAVLHRGDASIPATSQSTWTEVPTEGCYRVTVIPRAQEKS